MDYVVGSVADLISGNVTPNRPKLLKRALTPMKHQPSPNVTPKSELVSDRSILLSPTVQKKKAIMKKSPKRIFENPDLGVRNENNENSLLTKPKVDKVKKHLKDDLNANIDLNNTILSPKSSKNKLTKLLSSKKNENLDESVDMAQILQTHNETTPKKKKKKRETANVDDSEGNRIVDGENYSNLNTEGDNEDKTSPQKRKKTNQFTVETITAHTQTPSNDQVTNTGMPKKKKKKQETSKVDDSEGNRIVDNKNNSTLNTEGEYEDKTSHKKRIKANQFTVETITAHTQIPSNDQVTNTDKTEKVITKNNKSKLRKIINETIESDMPEIDKNQSASVNTENEKRIKKKKIKKHNENTKQATEAESNKDDKDNIDKVTANTNASPFINPNAITNQDTDSEHESDDEIQSDNDETNKTVLNTGPEESSDDEEEEQKPKKKIEKDFTNKKRKEEHEESEEEVKRTLFVGNVPFSNKCKKEIKRIFNKYGDIETVRIRTVPVKDARVTPKLAVIKNELHPDRSTVNVYIKYKQSSSVDQALAENNTVLNNHHLRVARSDVTGSEHDPKCSVFVGNIPFGLEDEGLRAKFEKCGQIESVRIIRDRKTNAGKGFGYVNFASKDGVELALALPEEDLTIKNRILRVKRCTQLTANRQQNNQNVRGKHQNYHQSKSNYNQRGEGSFQMNQSRNQFGNNRFQRQDQQNSDGKNEGAYRRIMNKRKPQDGFDGPPSKRPRDINQPFREKKMRKEFVGMTAAKKKGQRKKINKGQKKNKVISEILTKGRH